MKRSINYKQKFRIPIILFVVTILLTFVFSAHAGMVRESQTNALEAVKPQRRVNIPYLGAAPPVEFFEPAIFWFGQVTPINNYTDVRLWHYDDYMRITLHIIDRRLWFDESPSSSTLDEWDAVTLYLNLDGAAGDSPATRSYRLVSGLGGGDKRQAAYQGDGSKWVEIPVPHTAAYTWRGSGYNDNSDAKGWQLTYTIPFTNLGLDARPPEGSKWGLSVALHDRDESDGSPAIPDQVWPESANANVPGTWGEMNFGIPAYARPNTEQKGIITIRQGLDNPEVIDGHVGGHTTCGDGLDHWTQWGEENYAGYSQINIQNQWDIADYPCFSKYYVTFPLKTLPANKNILEASLSMTMFGNAGGGVWGVPPESFIEVFTVTEEWDEKTLNWNNAPLPQENIGGTWVKPVQTSDQRTYDWDISRAVAEAYQQGQPLRLALYSIDGERHSGKYFQSSDAGEDVRPKLKVVWGEACTDDCGTSTPVPPTNTPVPPTNTPTPEPPHTGEDSVFISSSSSGSVGGVTFDDEDILEFDTATGKWSKLFDGSDVGLSGSSYRDIDAFHILEDDSILMSLTGYTNVPHIGMVDDSDIVRFIPTSLGEDTAGTFTFYFDGSDMGLTTYSEDIDALTLLDDGDLLVSTLGSGEVGTLRFKDEDVLRFSPVSKGSDTSGSWSLNLDGSDVYLNNTSGEDIWGISFDGVNKSLHLTTRGYFDVNTLSGDGADIFDCVRNDSTTCDFKLKWQGSAHGFSGEIIDSISLPISESTPPPTNTPVPPPPTNTPVPPTNTPVPPTSTNTPVPPTNTPVPPTNTPVPPTNTPVPSTNTPVPPTNTPVPSPPTNTPVPPLPPGSGREFFLSPSGNDGRSGASPGEAWKTFSKAWTVLVPGDTLTLLNGVYAQALAPSISGSSGSPITIRAQNDGQAVIDGQNVRVPVDLNRSYLVIEGIVARNGASQYVYRIEGDHNVLRRVSGFDADTDENSKVFSVAGDYNVIEDCVASGSGRKMILVFKGGHNTIRRCIADWREWDGRNMCSSWPYGAGIEFYTASNNTMENVISYGHVAGAGIEVMAQGGAASTGNKVLGSMAIASGMKLDGTPMIWGDTRPAPAVCPDSISNIYGWPGQMYGFWVMSSGGIVRDNTLQDILASGSARYGVGSQVINTDQTVWENNTINRATIFGNGLNNPHPAWGGVMDTSSGDMARFTRITNSYIEKIWQGGETYTTQIGEGARLSKRYIDGVLTNDDLWPWPMEDRIKAELGYSVTCRMGTIINDAYATGKAAEGIDMNGRDPYWATDSNNLVFQACKNE